MAKIPVVPMGGGAGIVTGSYTGNGGAQRSIVLGFRPKAVLVFRRTGETDTAWGGLAIDGHPTQAQSGYDWVSIIEITDTGFSVFYKNTNPQINTNTSDNLYYYIAFR